MSRNAQNFGLATPLMGKGLSGHFTKNILMEGA